jgi:Fe-S-cluster containining protein
MVGEPEGHRRLLEEVTALYGWIDARQKHDSSRAGRCRACGACCDFTAYDHRLYVTVPELMYLADRLGTRTLRPMHDGRCPYQQGSICTVHAHRFASCRIFTCDGDPDFQSGLSEEVLRRLKVLSEEGGIPYRYRDLATALAAFPP